MQLRKYFLGELLFLANSRPPYWREAFYKIKDRMLKDYAVLEGHHLQHIYKSCFNCEGTGKVMKDVRMLGEWIKMPAGTCPKCNGSGRYEEFWTVLASYRLGRRLFHLPIKKCYSKLTLPNLEYTEIFESYIRHQRPKYYLYEEAAFWLALFFDRETFFRRFGRIGFCSRKFTPMVVLSTWIYETRKAGKRLAEHAQVWKRKLVRFRQAHCKHSFSRTHFSYWHEPCEKCGMKRMYVGCDRDAIPF